jgi:hypothetical protein
MKQTKDESRFIPIGCERGRAKAWNEIRVQYSFFLSMAQAHSRRMYLFRTEGQGYARAFGMSHNKARFPSRCAPFIPPRERAHERARESAERDRERDDAITALRYARRYGTMTERTIERAISAKIRVRERKDIQSREEEERQFSALMGA